MLNYPIDILPTNITIGNFCSISPFASIGNNVIIGNRVTINAGVVIGDGCMVYDGVCIGYDPQHLQHYKRAIMDDNTSKIITIGKNTIIRENCTIHMPFSSGETHIGSGCFLMANVHIAHDCTLDDNVVVANNVAFGGHCVVGEHANIGLNACVHQYTHIGEHSMVGMGSVLTKDVLPFHLVAGAREDMKVAINTIGYGRNYKGKIPLSDIKKFRFHEYSEDCGVHPELIDMHKAFKAATKNGIYH